MYLENPMNYSVAYDKEHGFSVLEAMRDVNNRLVEELFSEKPYAYEGRDLYSAKLWLKSDIITLLMKCDDVAVMAETITDIIKESPFSDKIFEEHIDMEELVDDVRVRKDFDVALSSVELGRELAPRIGYAFGEEDLKNLALLHKAGKHRNKIESLLEACNFHYENSLFYRGNYDQFLAEKPARKGA